MKSNQKAVDIISTDDEEPRLLDIPRDTSDSNAEPFFKLPPQSTGSPPITLISKIVLGTKEFDAYK